MITIVQFNEDMVTRKSYHELSKGMNVQHLNQLFTDMVLFCGKKCHTSREVKPSM